jgi:hypothetical protein
MMETTHTGQANISQQAATLAQSTEQFRQYLATAVTMRIQQLAATGGPTVAQAQAVTDHLDHAQARPLFPLPGTEHPTTRQTAEALAVLSFIPGGIDALGMHCQASATPPVVLYSSFV